nr:ribonuclease H-like domain-containing protein [Tanacetum cinerariifolium]
MNHEQPPTTQNEIPHLIIPNPPKNPNHNSGHRMVMRLRVGTNRPSERLNWHVSSVSPLPKCYHDAFSDLNWKNAMRDEYSALIKNRTWVLVHRPTDTNIVRCIRTPIDSESKLGADGDSIFDLTLYRSLAGFLQYLTFTHPNIFYVVQQVCFYMHDPQEPHFSALNAVYFSSNPVQHQRTKHIEIDIHFVHDLVADGQGAGLRIPTPFVNARKKRVQELFKEYFYRNGDVYKTLDLDDDDLEMIGDYLDLNPNEGFVDIKEEEIEEMKCKLLGIPYSSLVLMIEEKFLFSRYKSRVVLEVCFNLYWSDNSYSMSNNSWSEILSTDSSVIDLVLTLAEYLILFLIGEEGRAIGNIRDGNKQDTEYALSKLLKMGTVEYYQREFEMFIKRVTIIESLIKLFYISELILALQCLLFRSNLKTLAEAFSLALVVEARFTDLQLLEFIRYYPSNLGETFFRARITKAHFKDKNNQAVDTNVGDHEDPDMKDKQDMKKAEDKTSKMKKARMLKVNKILRDEQGKKKRNKRLVIFFEVGANKDNNHNGVFNDVGGVRKWVSARIIKDEEYDEECRILESINFFRHHLKGKVVVKDWRMIRLWL